MMRKTILLASLFALSVWAHDPGTLKPLPDGDSFVAGAISWDTLGNPLKFYNGTSWVDVPSGRWTDQPVYYKVKLSRSWTYSAAFLASASVADAASSWHGYELNPVLGRGQFGAKQTIVKAAIVGGLLGVEWAVMRKKPEMRKAFAWTNWIAGGATAGVAARNWNQR